MGVGGPLTNVKKSLLYDKGYGRPRAPRRFCQWPFGLITGKDGYSSDQVGQREKGVFKRSVFCM